MIIPPNRQEALTEEGRPTTRFSDVLEDMVDAINDLVVRPVNTQDSDYTFVLTDAVVRKTSDTSLQVYTIPSNDELAFDVGRLLEVQNDGSVAMQVAITDDTMTFEADGTTGTRTIGAGGSGRFFKAATTNWKCRGQQMT